MITPNRIKIEGEEITDEDIVLEVKKTKLILERARLRVGLPLEPEENPLPEMATEPEIFTEEQKEMLRSIPFVWLLLIVSNILII